MTFRGYEYKLVLGAEDLGDCYLGPVAWGHQKGFTTPISLLGVLVSGEVEGDGIQVKKKDGSSITFIVSGYDGEVTISTRFRQFIMDVSKGKPLANALMGVGVIDGLTARLVQEKVAVLSPPPASGIPARSTGVDNSDLEAALEGMGYNQAEIRGMIARANLPPWMPIEERVKAVLETNQG